MASARGMSLIEVLVVIGMIALLTLGGSIALVSDLRIASTNDDRDRLVDALLLARARSMHDTRGHGVYITESTFIVFKGKSYPERIHAFDVPFPYKTSIENPSGSEVVFTNGLPDSPHDFVLDTRIKVLVQENGLITSDLVL